MEIKVGEYVRTKDGIIDKIKTINRYGTVTKYDNKEDKISVAINYYINTGLEVNEDDIVNHSFNIKELIENKDILKVKTKENEILMIGFDENTMDIKYKKIIEEIENGDYELLEILTHEQYERACYEVEEK